MNDEPLLRVMSLHALSYCERLFYLEEVEEIRVADEAVFDGRRVHEELEEGTLASFTLEAPEAGPPPTTESRLPSAQVYTSVYSCPSNRSFMRPSRLYPSL